MFLCWLHTDHRGRQAGRCIILFTPPTNDHEEQAAREARAQQQDAAVVTIETATTAGLHGGGKHTDTHRHTQLHTQLHTRTTHTQGVPELVISIVLI